MSGSGRRHSASTEGPPPEAAERTPGGPPRLNEEIASASEVGHYLNTWRVYPPLAAICKAAGVEFEALHILRHTSGSLLLQQGTGAKLVSKRLGHTDVTFTLWTNQNVYADSSNSTVVSIGDEDDGTILN